MLLKCQLNSLKLYNYITMQKCKIFNNGFNGLNNLKYKMSHTNKIGILVRNPINAVVMSNKLTYIV